MSNRTTHASISSDNVVLELLMMQQQVSSAQRAALNNTIAIDALSQATYSKVQADARFALKTDVLACSPSYRNVLRLGETGLQVDN